MKKTLVIVLLILALCASLFLFLHSSRDSPSITTIGNGNISIIGDVSPKIDINNASPEALESLPGIGRVLALRIIQGRPYADVEALDHVKGIGPKTIEGLKRKVVTH